MGVARTTETMARAQCARTTADAIALAVVAYGPRVGLEFAGLHGASVDIESGSPTVVHVNSPCGSARSAATWDQP